MSTIPIDLPAGRELDALVDERVMGIARKDRPGPMYSTDIAAAWHVVEKLLPRFSFMLDNYMRSPRLADRRYEARFTEPHRPNFSGREPFVKAEAETAPLAIARAALKAAGLA